MYRPSGIAIVTAGLGALALFQVVWGRDTRSSEPWPPQDTPVPKAAFDLGTTFQFHSGAWRAWPAPVEEVPAKAPATPTAPEVVADPAPKASTPRDQNAPTQQTIADGEPSTATPSVAAGYVAFTQPARSPAADAPPRTTTPPEGRMALAGPRDQPPPEPAAQAGHAAPAAAASDRAPEVAAPAAGEDKFGPAIFKQFDRGGS
jgi:hypothetical protein